MLWNSIKNRVGRWRFGRTVKRYSSLRIRLSECVLWGFAKYMKIIRDELTLDELRQMAVGVFENMVKAVVAAKFSN